MSLEDDSPVAHQEPCEEKTLDCDRASFLGSIQELELCEEASATNSDCTRVAHRTLRNVAVDLEHGDLEMHSPDGGAAPRDSSMPSKQAVDCVPHAEVHVLEEGPVEACDSALTESGDKQQELQLTLGDSAEAPTSVCDGRSTSGTDVRDIGPGDGGLQFSRVDGNSAAEMDCPGEVQGEDPEAAMSLTDALEEARTPVLATADVDVASELEDEQAPGESIAFAELAGAEPRNSDPDVDIPAMPASVPSDCKVTDTPQCMASSSEWEEAVQELSEGIAEFASKPAVVDSPSITNAEDASTSTGLRQQDESDFGVILQDRLSAACVEPFEERLSGRDGVCMQSLVLCQDKLAPVSDCREVPHRTVGNMAADIEHGFDGGTAPRDSSMPSKQAVDCVPHAEVHVLEEGPVEACDSALTESGDKQQELQLTLGDSAEAPTSVCDGRSTSGTDVRDIGPGDGCLQFSRVDGNSAAEMDCPGEVQGEDPEAAMSLTDALEEARTPALATADVDVASELEVEPTCSKLAVAGPGSSDIPLPTLPASVPSDTNVIESEFSTRQLQDASEVSASFHEATNELPKGTDRAASDLDSRSFANATSALPGQQMLTVSSAGASNVPASSNAADSRTKQPEPALRHSPSTSCLSLKTSVARKDCRSNEAAAFNIEVSLSLPPSLPLKTHSKFDRCAVQGFMCRRSSKTDLPGAEAEETLRVPAGPGVEAAARKSHQSAPFETYSRPGWIESEISRLKTVCGRYCTMLLTRFPSFAAAPQGADNDKQRSGEGRT